VPTYNYRCLHCGPFTAHRPMALFDRPASCPSCGTESGRMPSVPDFPGMRRNGETARRAAAQNHDAGYRRFQQAGVCTCCSTNSA